MVLFVSKSLIIHSKLWKWVFVYPDCSEHYAVPNWSFADKTVPYVTHIMCTAFCMCDKGLEFFLVKLLGKTSNCNINGIFNYYPDISISSFNSYCPVPNNVPHVTENFYYLAET